MKLGEIPAPSGATHRPKRLGFGESSGHGKTSGKGHKGQRARSGHGIKPGFEGGQMPLIRRIPKRGFRHPRSWITEIINVETLNRFQSGCEVNPASLVEAGLVRATGRIRVKILGDGELKQSLNVTAHGFSESARKKILDAGGKVELIPC